MSQETTQPYPVVSNYSIDESEFILGIQALGSVIKAQSLGLNLDQCTSSLALVSGTLRLTPVYLKNPSTITGVKWFQQVQGSYTGDTSSRVGLYTYVAGVLTLVASCTDDTALWKVAANTMGIKAFTTPYVAAAGLYFIGILYHSSAQTTAPTIVSALNVNNAAQNSLDLANSAALSLTLATQTSLPTPLNLNTCTPSNNLPWLAIY